MKIDTTEQFELLPKAPIVEAAIHVYARPESPWDQKAIQEQLKIKLPEYGKILSQTQIRHQVKLDATHPPESSEQNLGWHGLWCKTQDELQSIQFNRDGFLFSRLNPYQSWDAFFSEAARLWKIYLEIARPVDAQRIGLRFIHKIPLPLNEVDFEKYIQPYPEPPFGLELPFLTFFHQDILAVPGYPYAVSIIRTIQPPQNLQTEGLGLIVDIDAYTTQPFEIKDRLFEDRLAELRWLKNKAFFGSITSEALKLFR